MDAKKVNFEVDVLDVDALELDPENRKEHTEAGLEMLGRSLDENGAARSIVIDENGEIMAGNATVKAAIRAGIKKVLVIDSDGSQLVAVRRAGLTDEQKVRLALFDNRTAELSGWSADQLFADLEDGRDFDGIFTTAELSDLIGDGYHGPGGVPPDPPDMETNRGPELMAKWGTERGQVWRLGDHLVMCGDCTKPDDLAQLLGDEKPDGLISDPPYSSGGATRADRVLSAGKKYQFNQDGIKVRYTDFEGDNKDQRAWILWCHMWLSLIRDHCAPAAVLGLFIDWRQLPALTDAVQSAAWVWRGIGVWDKTEGARPLFGRFRPQAEYLVWGSLGAIALNDGSPTYPGVIRQAVRANQKYHLTQKPIEVSDWSMSMVKAGGLVFDPFGGAGTSVMSCERTGRKGRMMEINPAYVAVTLERWLEMTGNTAEVV